MESYPVLLNYPLSRVVELVGGAAENYSCVMEEKVRLYHCLIIRVADLSPKKFWIRHLWSFCFKNNILESNIFVSHIKVLMVRRAILALFRHSTAMLLRATLLLSLCTLIMAELKTIITSSLRISLSSKSSFTNFLRIKTV